MDDMSSSQEANERECFASQKASKEFPEKHLFLTSNKMQNNNKGVQRKRLMKRTLKWIGIIICAIVGSAIGLFCLLIFLSLVAPKEESGGNGSIIIEYNGDISLPFSNKPEPVYADTKEEALTYHVDYYFCEYPYMMNVNNVIKLLENDEYATMFYTCFNENDKKVQGFVASKFNIRIVNGKKQYALTNVNLIEQSDSRRAKLIDALPRVAPLYDYLTKYSIIEGKRFFWGSTESKKIKTLKIEGQSPTEIIEYTRLGKPEYFWYYEDLISDKPSSEFEIELEE